MAQFIYLETAAESGVFHCRGEIGAGDSPASFAAMMAKGGLRVIGTDGSEFEWERDTEGALVEGADGNPVRKALVGATVEAEGLTLKTIGALNDVNANGTRTNIVQRLQIAE